MGVGGGAHSMHGKPRQPTTPLPYQSVMAHEEASGQEKGPPISISRARIKRKLQGGMTIDSVSSKIKQDKEKSNRENQSATSDQPVCMKAKEIPSTDDHATCNDQSSVATLMPEKHTLELILDVLQRRDANEIFAQPVDSEQVENYYEIIEEPMDFGTMRAKLHEGMYGTLEQFEHDVFLISGNAMHFNSSGSIYFRQARAIDDLAKKVFHVLKTDPENFVLEFSGTRRRSGRRSHGEAMDRNFNTGTRCLTNLRPGRVTNHASSRGKLGSLTGPSTSKKNIPGFVSAGAHVDKKEYALFYRARDGSRSSFVEADRRSTYSPRKVFHDKNKLVLPEFHTDPKQLALVNQNYINYRESLLLFVKDLGLTAQMVAKRKLQGFSRDTPTLQTANCIVEDAMGHQARASFASSLSTWESDIMTNKLCDQKVVDLLVCRNRTVLKPTNEIIDLTDVDDGEKAVYVTTTSTTSTVRLPPRAQYLCAPNIIGKTLNFLPREKIRKSQRTEDQDRFGPHSGVEDLDSSTMRIHNSSVSTASTALVLFDKLKNDKPKSAAQAASESSQVSGFNLRNKINRTTSSLQTTAIGFSSFSEMGNSTRFGPKCRGTCSPTPSSTGDGHGVMTSNQHSSSSSRFTFDMSFLKSQLNQMKVTGQRHQQQDRSLEHRKLIQCAANFGTGIDDGQSQGTLVEPRGRGSGGYIKVPVHFAEPSSSPAQSTFLQEQQPHDHSGSASIHITTTTADTDLALQLLL